jgi:hypothetical protein
MTLAWNYVNLVVNQGEDREPNFLQNNSKFSLLENLVFDASNTPTLAPGWAAASPASTTTVQPDTEVDNKSFVFNYKNNTYLHHQNSVSISLTKDVNNSNYFTDLLGNSTSLMSVKNQLVFGSIDPNSAVGNYEESTSVATSGDLKAYIYAESDQFSTIRFVIYDKESVVYSYRIQIDSASSTSYTNGIAETWTYQEYVEPKVCISGNTVMFVWKEVLQGSTQETIKFLAWTKAGGVVNSGAIVGSFSAHYRISLTGNGSNGFGIGWVESYDRTTGSKIGFSIYNGSWSTPGLTSLAANSIYVSNASVTYDSDNSKYVLVALRQYVESATLKKQFIASDSTGFVISELIGNTSFNSPYTPGRVTVTFKPGTGIIAFCDDVYLDNTLYLAAGSYCPTATLPVGSWTASSPLRQPISKIFVYLGGGAAYFDDSTVSNLPVTTDLYNNNMIYGEAAVVGNQVYLPTINPSAYDPTITVYRSYINNINLVSPVAIIAPRNAGNFPKGLGAYFFASPDIYGLVISPIHSTSVWSSAYRPDKVVVSYTEWSEGPIFGISPTCTAKLAELYDGPRQAIELNNLAFLPAAAPHIFDGTNIFQANFTSAPFIELTEGASSSGSLTAGTYQFCATWGFSDSQGNWYESAPSLPQSILIVGTGVGVKVKDARFACPATNMKAELIVYRTEKNGTVFRRDLYNSSTKHWGLTTDSDWLSGTLLYTEGGIHENDPIPGCNAATIHDNRIFVTDGDNVYFTDQVSPSYEFSHSAGYQITCKSEALASIDEKLITFGPNIQVIHGQGPDELGLSSTYNRQDLHPILLAPQAINSVLVTKDGIWFQSTEGLRLLSRSLSIAMGQEGPIGQEMDEAIELCTVRSAFDVKDKGYVVFFYNERAQGLALKAVVFNENQQWTSWAPQNSAGTLDLRHVFLKASQDTSAYDTGALVFGGFGYTTNTLTLYTQSSSIYSSTVETSWLNFDDIEGFQRMARMQFLCKYDTSKPTNITLTTYFDYNAVSSVATQNIALTMTGSNPVAQFEYQLPKQKFTAVKFKLVFVPGSPDTKLPSGFSPQGFRFKIGKKAGSNKLPSTKRF